MQTIRLAQRLGASAAVIAGCCGLAATSVASATPAHARPARRHACSPTGRPLRILTPCAGATIDVAHNRNFTVTVYESNASSQQYRPFLYIARGGRVKHGVLITSPNGDGIDIEMKRGRHDEYTFNTRSLPKDTFPGYWRVTSGTYRMQVQQVTDGGMNVSPIETLHFRA